MHIEEQILSPLKPTCVLPVAALEMAAGAPVALSQLGSFPFAPAPKNLHDWTIQMREKLGLMVYQLEQKPGSPDPEMSQQVCGSYMAIDCTEFADRTLYPHAWEIVQGTESDILAALPKLFDGRGARILHIAIKNDDKTPGTFTVIAVPNYGPANRGWWWGTRWNADQVSAFVHGNGAGVVKADGIPKKITSLVRRKNGLFAFVMNERKAGAWFAWGHGAKAEEVLGAPGGDVVGALNGTRALQAIKADGIKKRLLDISEDPGGGVSYAMEHADGAMSHLIYAEPWDDVASTAASAQRRIVRLRHYLQDDDSDYIAITTHALL